MTQRGLWFHERAAFLSMPLWGLQDEEVTFQEVLRPGERNLLLFYNHDCLGCTGRALPYMYELIREGGGFHPLVLHSDFQHKNYSGPLLESAFVTGQSPFPIYREKGRALFDAFACDGTPHWILLDGNLEMQHSIFGSQEGAQQRLAYALME